MAGATIETLRRVPLFAELDVADLESIAAAMRERTFEAGETVTVEGTPSDGFFVIDKGEAAVTLDGKPRRTLGPGDYVGEIALLMGSERTATVTARSELRCHALSPLDFRAVVESNPTIAWDVMQSMAERLE